MPYEKLKEEHYTNLKGMNPKSSNYINTEGESIRVVNLDFTRPGAWTKVPGTTLYTGATVAGVIDGINQFTRLSGASYLIVGANTNLYSVTSSFTPIRTGLRDNALFDFVPFVDRLFSANGQDFFKTDGVNAAKYSLPPGDTLSLGSTGSGGFTGFFQYAYGYLNDRGYAGPVSPLVGFSVGGAFAVDVTGFTTPNDYGITSILIYRSENNQTSDVFQIGSIPAGGTLFSDTGFTLSNSIAPPYIWFTLAPRYIELFNNQLFSSGFSSMLSTVYFSDIGEPEGVGATAFFEVRTNDGDRVTGMKSYFSQLVLTKEKSFHALSGDNPQNFTLREVSDQYGNLSNRAMAVFQDTLFFLDRKGICKWNGANIEIVSTKVEDLFLRMNIAAARDQASMLHVKDRNEIWTLFPIDGSTLNNQLVVYDYYCDAWYERRGLDIQTLVTVQTPTSGGPYPFYGGYTGSLFKFDETLCGDNGRGITCSVFTNYHSPLGNSTDKMFRRLWLDTTPVDPAVGGTVSVAVNFYVNHNGSTPALTRTMYGTTFQTRIDFGVDGKSLAFEFIHVSESQPLQINGYTIANRYQRNV